MPEDAKGAHPQKIVVGLNGGPTDDQVVHLACQLAKPGKTELVAVHVIEVDWRHELSEDMASENESASAVLDRAEGIAESYKVKMTGDLLQAREVAAALVDEAVELEADLVIIGLPYRTRFGGDFAIGPAIPYILRNAPCQVLVVREPVPTGGERRETRQPALTSGRAFG